MFNGSVWFIEFYKMVIFHFGVKMCFCLILGFWKFQDVCANVMRTICWSSCKITRQSDTCKNWLSNDQVKFKLVLITNRRKISCVPEYIYVNRNGKFSLFRIRRQTKSIKNSIVSLFVWNWSFHTLICMSVCQLSSIQLEQPKLSLLRIVRLKENGT